MRGSYLSRSGKLSALVASTVGLGLCSSAAHAATILWAAAVEADWHVDANWNPAQVPTNVAADVAQVNNGGTTVYSAASGTRSVGSITLGTSANETGNMKMSGGSLTLTNTDFRIGGNAATTTNAVGTFEQTGGDITMNAGNLNIGQGSSGTGATPSSGTYTLSNGTLTLASANIMAVGNRGTGVVNQSGGTIYVRGAAANAATAVLQLGRNTAAVPGRGTYTLSGGTAVAANTQFGNAVQTSNAFPTNTFNLQGTGTLRTGTISILNTAATNIFNFTGGTLTATTVNIPLTNNGGSLSPATLAFTGAGTANDVVTNPIGLTTINNAYTQGATGSLAIDIAALGAGNFDRVSVTGAASVNGFVNVSMLAGFEPNLGDTFDVLTATGGLTGLPVAQGATGAGKTFVASVQGGNTLRLTVVPEPSSTLALLGGLACAGAVARRGRGRRREG